MSADDARDYLSLDTWEQSETALGCRRKHSIELEGWWEWLLLAFEAGLTCNKAGNTVNIEQETLPAFGGKDNAVFKGSFAWRQP